MNRPPARRWLYRTPYVCATIAALLGLGCAEIVGHYEVGEEPEAGPDIGTFGPMGRKVGEECVRCGADHCATAARECMADASCAKLAECALERQPEVLSCYAAVERDKWFAAASCIHTNCREACLWGTNWTCLGKFPLPSKVGLSKASVSVEITRQPPGVFWEGLRIRACDAADESCEPPLAVAPGLTVDGPISIDVPPPFGVFTNGVSGFIGYFEVTSPGDPSFGTLLAYQAFPIVSDTVVLRTIPPGGLPSVAPDGLLVIETQDCWGGPGRQGIVFDVRTADGRSHVPGYKRADSEEWTDQLSETTDAGIAIVQVPPGKIDVTASFGGKLIGQRRVLVRAGALTSVVVPPRSSSGAIY